MTDCTNAFRRGQFLRALPASEEPTALLVGCYCVDSDKTRNVRLLRQL